MRHDGQMLNSLIPSNAQTEFCKGLGIDGLSKMIALCNDPKRPWWVNTPQAIEWAGESHSIHAAMDLCVQVEDAEFTDAIAFLRKSQGADPIHMSTLAMLAVKEGKISERLTRALMLPYGSWNAQYALDYVETLVQVALDAGSDSVRSLQYVLESWIETTHAHNLLGPITALARQATGDFDLSSASQVIKKTFGSDTLQAFLQRHESETTEIVQSKAGFSIDGSGSLQTHAESMAMMFLRPSSDCMDWGKVYRTVADAFARLGSLEMDQLRISDRQKDFLDRILSICVMAVPSSLHPWRLYQEIASRSSVTLTSATLLHMMLTSYTLPCIDLDSAISRILASSTNYYRNSDIMSVTQILRRSLTQTQGVSPRMWVEAVKFIGEFGTQRDHREILKLAYSSKCAHAFGMEPDSLHDEFAAILRDARTTP